MGAHDGSVSAALRLRCGARPGVASHNSLRSLRSLRSNTCDESVYEARFARRLQACAPRRPINRPHRVPPAAQPTAVAVRMRDRHGAEDTTEAPPDLNATRGGCKGLSGQASARLCGAEERSAQGRERSEPRHLTCRMCLSAVSEANVASYAAGPVREDRRGVGAQRRPPHRSAEACPGSPLPPRTHDRHTRQPHHPMATPIKPQAVSPK